jgi:hypothetical protein
METTEHPYNPDITTQDQSPTRKSEEKELSKTHTRAGFTKNKGKGLSKAIRVISRKSRQLNRKRG